jgi:hypothetical protein
MPGLAHAISRYNARKQEHLEPSQTIPTGRSYDGSPRPDVDEDGTLARLIDGTGVTGPEAAAGALYVVTAVMRQIRRAGILRAAKQDALRAVLFAVWLDGLTTGLMYDRDADAAAEAQITADS